MKSLEIEKYINPNIKIGDKIKMHDGSSFTDYETGEKWYIVYPLQKDGLKPIKDIIGEVIETGCEYIISSGIDDSCYLQDIVVNIGGRKFRTASGMVTKVRAMSFKKFIEEHNLNWNNFLENCKPENQRWTAAYEFYDHPEEKFQENPLGFIREAFNWKVSEVLSPRALFELDHKWQNFVEDYKGIITFE